MLNNPLNSYTKKQLVDFCAQLENSLCSLDKKSNEQLEEIKALEFEVDTLRRGLYKANQKVSKHRTVIESLGRSVFELCKENRS